MADVQKCLVCAEEIEYPKWKCPKRPGKHAVPSKTYFHPGGTAIADAKERRAFSVAIVLNAADRVKDEKDKWIEVPGCVVQFHAGKYTTEDPEEQYYLDRKQGLCSEERWQQIYMTHEQRSRINEEKLTEQKRQIEEYNALLAQVKAQKESPKARPNA